MISISKIVLVLILKVNSYVILKNNNASNISLSLNLDIISNNFKNTKIYRC